MKELGGWLLTNFGTLKLELFDFFLVNYNCSLNLLKNLVNYTYFGSCPKSEVFVGQCLYSCFIALKKTFNMVPRTKL